MSQPQYLTALERANEVRLARPGLKREVGSGSLSIGDALLDERASSMPIFDLLVCQWRWGRVSAFRVLNGLRIGEQKHVGDLTERQRELLVQACSPKREAA